jgi:putative ABC transport system ATP-binding protein
MTTPLLRLTHLSRQVGEKLIVNDVNLTVDTGDLIAVIGPSGAGKSSLLRLINRLDEPTGGTVYLNGEDYRQIAPRALRRRVGMMMQAAHLFPGTVAENLRFGPRQQGQELSDAAVDTLLDQAGLPGFANREVTYLSGGEAQRVSLARTLANRPALLLLDEPTSALDEHAAQGIETLLRQIFQAAGLTALMITHDTAQAERIANRAILIEAGQLLLSGTVAEVLHADAALP